MFLPRFFSPVANIRLFDPMPLPRAVRVRVARPLPQRTFGRAVSKAPSFRIRKLNF